MLVSKKAFSLIEAVVSIAIFVIFAFGVYGGIQLTFKIIYASRLRIIENAVLNEEIEIIRNLSYYDVGIIQGSPAGILTRSSTTTRNGIELLITRTIRNIDDPYDGTATGGGGHESTHVDLCHKGNTISVSQSAKQAHLNHGDTLGPCGGVPPPFDSSPADYKLVQIDVICTRCSQKEPLSMITYVAPKFLEGDPTRGSLFIEVFDANGQPIQDATVHIVSTSTDPTYDFVEITDNDGMLRVVDLASGDGAYAITVTKPGYTIDQTMVPSVDNPNPIKPAASVIAQSVSEVSFSIDRVSSVALQTIDTTCGPVGTVSVTMQGSEHIGTDPNVFANYATVQTDALGNYTFENLRWDTLTFLPDGYDLLGSISDLPFALAPNTNQSVRLVLGPNTANSLLVVVRDSTNGQPIANAGVTVSSVGFSSTLQTGIGSIRQTDWSGGGQELMVDTTKFFASSNIDFTTTQGDIVLASVGGSYISSGILESSIYDLGAGVDYVQLTWEPLSQPTEAGIDSLRFQIATSASSTPETWEYSGPDGTSATYYTADSPVIHETHNGNQYFRYKVFLTTQDQNFTPRLSDISLTYTNSCTPPGQVYVGSLSAQEYTVSVNATGYESYTSNVNVSGNSYVVIELSQSD